MKNLNWRKFRNFIRFDLLLVIDFTKKNSSNQRIALCGNYRNLLSLKKNSSNQLFSNFFSKNVAFTKFLPIKSESKFPYMIEMKMQCFFSWNHWKRTQDKDQQMKNLKSLLTIFDQTDEIWHPSLKNVCLHKLVTI